MLVTGLGKDGVLLWDGECSFCALMVKWLRRIGRAPFCEQPFQSVAGILPQKLRRWSNCQAHWIDPSGEVIGGSAAVIKVLDHSGRGMLASLLDTGVCRPFLWLGYRLIARNRPSFTARQ